jgi:hypothetical protein
MFHELLNQTLRYKGKLRREFSLNNVWKEVILPFRFHILRMHSSNGHRETGIQYCKKNIVSYCSPPVTPMPEHAPSQWSMPAITIL